MSAHLEQFGTDHFSAFTRSRKLKDQGFNAEHFPRFVDGQTWWSVAWSDEDRWKESQRKECQTWT